ncbi:carboxymuconolactone decarboxylase family protein [Paenibacillus turpanensis]|uniref:carboxymuconolactone decarboxylase family protein n=1 Tax=Paenibacillus turpanensis TaxID=2689078 RepID=UPI00140B7C45|nr:carboxymuconolactone decarboxylase family protein [Paenibacillus turpanensis]
MAPNQIEGYHRFTGECFREGALSAREKQLIALGIALFANNEVCTFYHVDEALSEGATPEQVAEAAAVAAAASSGHIMSQSVTRVQQVLEQRHPLQ